MHIYAYIWCMKCGCEHDRFIASKLLEIQRELSQYAVNGNVVGFKAWELAV